MELSKVYTILVLNNSASRLDQLQLILRRAGYDILKVTDRNEACRLAFTQQPDLILIDETNPQTDQALVLRLREIEMTASIPILLTTSATSLALIEETEAANPYPSDTLQIPYDDFQLVSTITRLIIASAAARKISKSEERYRQLFEHANDIVYTTDLRGRYTSINQRGLDITGYTTEDVTSLGFTDIADPEDVALGSEMMRMKLERGTRQPTIYEMNIKTKDGSSLPIEINSQLIFEDDKPVGVQGIARDISKRKADEAALREAYREVEEANQRAITEYRHLLRRISALAETVGTARDMPTIFEGLVHFSHVSLPCSSIAFALYEIEHNHVLPQFVWTPDGTNDTRSSKKPLVLNGGTPGTVVLKKKIVLSDQTSEKFQSLDPAQPDAPPMYTTMTVPMLVAERVVGLLEIRGDDSAPFTEEHMTAISMAANIAAHGIENLRLQARDRDREHQLNQMQKMEALGRLAAGVAHDFNNIVTGIFGYCDLAILQIRETNQDQAVIHLIESAKDVGKRAKQFTEQLLGFSRKQVVKPISLNLNDAIKEFTRLITHLIGVNIEVEFMLEHNLPTVYLAPGQVQQIILNLAINARDAMPNGGRIMIETRVAHPKQPTHKPGATKDPYRSQVIMKFSDTGCGIDAETQKHIFEPFFTTKGQGGNGLGLAGVYGTVKQAGGSVACASQIGKGTTFTIRFPAAATSIEPEHEMPRPLPERRASYTILIAEDDRVVRHTLSTALRSAGYEVCTAENGQEALEIFERDQQYIHLVVTDLLMPQMNGSDLSMKIRKYSRNLPILYISGYPADAVTEDGELPADIQYIGKPFDHEEILRKIDDMLHGERDAQPTTPTTR